jgi:histidine kinase
MTSQEFIFSGNPATKASRHVAFWMVLILHFVIQNLMVGGVNEGANSRSFMDSAFYAAFFFPAYLFFVYLLICLVIPRFLFRNKYILFLIWTAILLFLNFVTCYFAGTLYIHVSTHLPYSKINSDANKYNALVNGLFLPVTIYGIAVGIKLAKKWYLEQTENERLAREKISRELQLLKTQLHPRFLFHSLHTIKNHIRYSSPLSPGLILQLSELLSYILYESDKKYQLIEKETEMIRSYIDLEKKSTEDRLATEINISGDGDGKYISPLLLLSFIETSFDCFLKVHPKDPSLKLTVTIWNDHLDYHLICNRFLDHSNDPAETKMKFMSLEKQLHFLYPGNHQIEIITNSSDITVVLNLPLHKNSSGESKNMFAQNELYELL